MFYTLKLLSFIFAMALLFGFGVGKMLKDDASVKFQKIYLIKVIVFVLILLILYAIKFIS